MACLISMLFSLVFGAGISLAGGLPAEFWSSLPLEVRAPNRFGLYGDDAWLEAGQKSVPVIARKHIVEVRGPGVLDRSDTEYRLMQDIEAEGTAFVIKNHRITLNLNGYTITYGIRPQGDENYGVHIGLWNFRDVRVLNGRIIQAEPFAAGGTGKRWETPYGTGGCPIWGRSVFGGEYAGLYLRYGGNNTAGINISGYGQHIHHNTIEDVGLVIENRHKGLAAIEGPASGGRHAHHNLVLRTRHNGIRGGKNSRMHHNVVYLDSQETNSAGISAGGEIHDNKIVGIGAHPLGVYIIATENDDKVMVRGNYIQVQNTRASREYGSAGSAGIRYQTGGQVEATNNTVIVLADADYDNSGFNSWGRGIWASVRNTGGVALFENNLVTAVAPSGRGKAAGLAVVADNVSADLVFRNNTVISSWAPVLLADSYGHADGFARFEDTTLIKSPDSPEFATIRSQYSERSSTGVFISSRFIGGASWDDVDLEFFGTGLKEIVVGWKVTVRVLSPSGQMLQGVHVHGYDRHGDEVDFGVTGEDGRVLLTLFTFRLSNRMVALQDRPSRPASIDAWRKMETPHVLVARQDGRESRLEVNVDRDLDLTMELR